MMNPGASETNTVTMYTDMVSMLYTWRHTDTCKLTQINTHTTGRQPGYEQRSDMMFDDQMMNPGASSEGISKVMGSRSPGLTQTSHVTATFAPKMLTFSRKLSTDAPKLTTVAHKLLPKGSPQPRTANLFFTLTRLFSHALLGPGPLRETLPPTPHTLIAHYHSSTHQSIHNPDHQPSNHNPQSAPRMVSHHFDC
jgi:hypothetical protein